MMIIMITMEFLSFLQKIVSPKKVADFNDTNRAKLLLSMPCITDL